MKVKARDIDVAACPPLVARFATPGQVFVKAGRTYSAHALAVFEGVPLLQVVDDLRYPAWLPAWLFEVVEASIPLDWISGIFLSEPTVIMGPEFIAYDHAAYGRMVELEPKEVGLFWSRVKALQGSKEQVD